MSKLYCRGSAVFFLIALLNSFIEASSSGTEGPNPPEAQAILSPKINDSLVDVDFELGAGKEDWAKLTGSCCPFSAIFLGIKIFGAKTVTETYKEDKKQYIRLKLIANTYAGGCCEKCFNTVKNAEEYLKKIDPDKENSPLPNKDMENSHFNVFRIGETPYLLCKNASNEYYLFPAADITFKTGEYRLSIVKNEPYMHFMKCIFSATRHESYSFPCLSNREAVEGQSFTIPIATKNYGEKGEDINFGDQTPSSSVKDFATEVLKGIFSGPPPTTPEEAADELNLASKKAAKETADEAKSTAGKNLQNVAEKTVDATKGKVRKIAQKTKDIAEKMTGKTTDITNKMTGKTDEKKKTPVGLLLGA